MLQEFHFNGQYFQFSHNMLLQFKKFVLGEDVFFGVVKDTLQNIEDHQDIPFKTVDVDIHNAFHGDSKIFTVPVAGYYTVFADIMTLSGTIFGSGDIVFNLYSSFMGYLLQ